MSGLRRDGGHDAAGGLGGGGAIPGSGGTVDVVVREADGNDLDSVVAVGRRTWPVAYEGVYEPEFVELFLAKWWTKDACIPAIRAGRTLVAEVAGGVGGALEGPDAGEMLPGRQGRHVVGLAAYGTQDGLHVVWKLYVLPQWQAHGIGGLLLQAVLDRVGDHTVYLSFAEGNASAAAFTAAHGFVEDSREAQLDMPDLIWVRRDPPGAGPGRSDGPGDDGDRRPRQEQE